MKDMISKIETFLGATERTCGKFSVDEWEKLNDLKKFAYCQSLSPAWRKETLHASDIMDFFDARCYVELCFDIVGNRERLLDLADNTSPAAMDMAQQIML